MSLLRFITRRNAVRWFCTVFGVAITALGLTVTPPRAASLIVDSGGQLTGATNVDLGSLGFYNVTFVDGSCIDLFGGCDELSDFDFTTEAAASIAAQALLDQVFIDGPDGQFDTIPQNTFGCGVEVLCSTFVPYGFRDDSTPGVWYAFALNHQADQQDTTAIMLLSADFDAGPQLTANIAKFEEIPPVPLPAALPLFGTGLGILGFLGWRRRRKAAAV